MKGMTTNWSDSVLGRDLSCKLWRWGGRWFSETQNFLSLLAKAKAQDQKSYDLAGFLG